MRRFKTLLGGMLLIPIATACGDGSEKDPKDMDDKETETTDDSATENPFRPDDLHEMADALATAIDGEGDPASTEIAVVPNLLCAFWIPNQIGVGRASSEIGCLSVFAPPPNGGTEEQLEILQNKIDNNFSGIAVSPTDPTEVEPTIDSAVTDGINVITFDSDSIAGSKRALYLGTLNRSAGRQAGKKMAELLGGTGKVAAFAGTFADGNNASERYAGVEEAFANTDIELLPPVGDDVDFDTAKDNVAQTIADHPDLAGIIGIWAYNGPKAAEVLQELDRVGEIKIVAFDLEPNTITYLRNGAIDAAIGQRPYWMGYLSVYILYAMDALGIEATQNILAPWVGRTDKDVIDTGTDVVTSDNLDVYLSYLESLGISSS